MGTQHRLSKRSFQRSMAILLVRTLVWGPPLSYAADGITPDGTTQTAIDRAQNDVPVVNIAPPT